MKMQGHSVMSCKEFTTSYCKAMQKLRKGTDKNAVSIARAKSEQNVTGTARIKLSAVII